LGFSGENNRELNKQFKLRISGQGLVVGYLGVGHGWKCTVFFGFLNFTSKDTGVRYGRSLLDARLLIYRVTVLDNTKSELPFCWVTAGVLQNRVLEQCQETAADFFLAYGLWRFTADRFLAYGKKSKFGEKPEKG